MANWEIDGESSDKLKGDTIGDTMYSQRWVLKLLMKLVECQLNEVQFNSSLEEDLCLLWDMTSEEHVSSFIKDLGMIDTIIKTANGAVSAELPRLTEIMVGILGNICSVKSIRQNCNQQKDILHLLINLMSCPDSPTLIQVLRVLQLFAFDIANPSNKQSQHSREEKETSVEVVNEDVNCDIDKSGCEVDESSHDCTEKDVDLNAKINVEEEKSHEREESENVVIYSELWYNQFADVDSWLPQIMFILNSSQNKELLEGAWSLLQTLCHIQVNEVYLFSRFLGLDLLKSLFESFNEYFDLGEHSSNTEPVKIHRCKQFANMWTTIFYSFTLDGNSVVILTKFKEPLMRSLLWIMKNFKEFLPYDADLLEQILSVVTDILSKQPYELHVVKLFVHDAVKLLGYLKVLKKEKLCSVETELEKAIKCIESYLDTVGGWLNSLEDTDCLVEIQNIKEMLSSKPN